VESFRRRRTLEAETEEELPLIRDESAGYAFSAEWSPDERLVALNWVRWQEPGLWTISPTDSSEKRLSASQIRPIAWSADGKWIYAEDGHVFLRVPATGGDPEVVFDRPCKPLPDARHFVCVTSESSSDVWIARGPL
jgi:hypothetical protein